MKKKIAILGSTGSIGKTTFKILKKNKKDFYIELLTTNRNINEILKQTKELKVKNIIVEDEYKFKVIKKILKNKKIKVHHGLHNLSKIIKNKIDYTMCAISGIDGLSSTLKSIKFSKKIAIANKESIICGWNLIEKKLKKYKTEFIPVDSEHFSIWSLLNNYNNKKIEEITITASGGPFLNLPLSKFNKIKPINALKHPNWIMGKKISIDSATLMNKVFEIIEAQRIFNVDIKKFKILIHPKSYLHAIIKFQNGLTKLVIHDTNMSIPIFNSIYHNSIKKFKTDKINLKILNNLNLLKPKTTRYPSIKVIKKIPNKISLYETVLISANDELVNCFLKKEINFNQIIIYLNKILNMKEFKQFTKIRPKKLSQILSLNKYVRLKTRALCIK